MSVMRYWWRWDGDEFVPLAEAHLPAHYHTIPAHNHALARTLPNYATNKSTSSGPYTIADVSSGVNWTENYPGGTTGSSAAASASPPTSARASTAIS